MDRETVTGKKRQSVPDKVTLWGDRFWSAADAVEAGIGRTSRAVSIKALKGCPAKHCYKRVMALIFSWIREHRRMGCTPNQFIWTDVFVAMKVSAWIHGLLLELRVWLKDTGTVNMSNDGQVIGVKEFNPVIFEFQSAICFFCLIINKSQHLSAAITLELEGGGAVVLESCWYSAWLWYKLGRFSLQHFSESCLLVTWKGIIIIICFCLCEQQTQIVLEVDRDSTDASRLSH